MTDKDRTRRNVLRGAAATAAGTAVCGTFPGSTATADAPAPQFGPVVVGPDDPRYQDLIARGNRRFAGRPEVVHVVGSTEQVVRAPRRVSAFPSPAHDLDEARAVALVSAAWYPSTIWCTEKRSRTCCRQPSVGNWSSARTARHISSVESTT